MATKKAPIYKQLHEQSKQKAGTLPQQLQDLRDELEGTRYKANDEVGKLKSLLNVDATNKETLQNRVETLEIGVVDIEHDCDEATEELEVSFVVEHLILYYVLLDLQNV